MRSAMRRQNEPVIRPATTADLPVLQDIETAAGKPFADIGMTAVADDEPPSLTTLEEFQRAGRAWVWTDEDVPIGYLVLGVVDGNAHIEQVSVRPDYAGRRIGKRLIDRAVVELRHQRPGRIARAGRGPVRRHVADLRAGNLLRRVLLTRHRDP
ncbi:GNAT family N-acetyltransferase, partial [Nocardia abscessus]|uniref:GNAT family N-acetyltransferase n=1 Tax=Nocardia abscessus TaxID=120957 RepID=UPI0024588419